LLRSSRVAVHSKCSHLELKSNENRLPPPQNSNNQDDNSSSSDNLDVSGNVNEPGVNEDPSLGDNSHSQASDTSSSPSLTDIQGVMSSSHGIPAWVRGIAGWWAEGKISDGDFVTAIKFLVHQGIIKL